MMKKSGKLRAYFLMGSTCCEAVSFRRLRRSTTSLLAPVRKPELKDQGRCPETRDEVNEWLVEVCWSPEVSCEPGERTLPCNEVNL